MSEEEASAIWDEVNSMREELDSLKIRRSMLGKHLDNLIGLADELQQSHAKAEAMAREVENHLEGRDDENV